METQPSPTTYVNFIAEINDKTSSLLMFLLTEQLRSGVNKFRLNISSPGGQVFHAVSLFNFLSGLKNVLIHTHNLGQIDSGANLIFLAGQKRTASRSSTFLMHPPLMQIPQPTSFSIELMEERVNSLKKDQEKMAEIIARVINKQTLDIIALFNSRKTYSSSEAQELGLISSTEEFVAEPSVPIYTITNQA